MITYDELIERPAVFKSLTGVSLSEFDELLIKLTPVWRQLEYVRLDRGNRQRAIGGGGDYKLPLRERLLMTLIWSRLCLNTETLGYIFGVNKSTVSRNTRNLLPALRQLSEVAVNWPEPPRRGQGKGIDQVLQEHPDLRALIGAAEEVIPGSSVEQTYQSRYAGKKKQPDLKIQTGVSM